MPVAQGTPKLVIPAWIHTEPCLHCNGPPESPCICKKERKIAHEFLTLRWHSNNDIFVPEHRALLRLDKGHTRALNCFQFSVHLNFNDNGIRLYLARSSVLLACTNHVTCDICILNKEIVAAALPVADDRNLNFLQWESVGQ